MPLLGITNITAGPLTVSQAWSRLRGPITGVGTGVCPYADTFGFANPNGVRGFIGPPAGALQQPTRWFVRVGGSNDNGGTGTSLAAERSGSDGAFSGNVTTFTSVTGNFTSADVGKGLCVRTGNSALRFKIVAVNSSTSVTVNTANTAGAISAQTWALGGAWADIRAVVSDVVVSSASLPSPLSANDTVYVGAGTYRHVTVVSTSAPLWQFNGQVNIVGDVTGQYTGDAGMVQITAYLTNDKTLPSGGILLNMNGKSNLAFSNIVFVSGQATMISSTAATSQNITFTDCAFLAGFGGAQILIQVNNAFFGRPLRWIFDRCVFFNGNAQVLSSTLTQGTGSDYTCDIRITNSQLVTGSNAIQIQGVGAGAAGGGITVRNCTIIAGLRVLSTTAAQASIVFPCAVYNSFLYLQSGNAALNAGTAGHIIEDYNLIVAQTPRANTTAGAHSISDGSYAPLFHAGHERIWSGLLRPFGEPMAGSPLLGFGNDGGQTTYDYYNRPRPAGGGALPYPAVGALERGNTPTQATIPVPPSGTNDWQFTGPGFQEFLLPVNNTSTTVLIKVQRDSAYSPPPGGTLPALQILANGRLGITAQTIVDTGSSGGWNTLIAQAFTPSGTGWVTVRIASFDGTGVSVVSFANLVVC